MRLLLIDDDTELCSLLVEFLKGQGFPVECAHEGYKGLDRALHDGFDLVILDVMLPGLDGFEILRRLRQESRVPVLMLTARGEDVDRIIGLELGADDYLLKPFNPRELVARVRAILRRYEPRTASAAERMEVNGVALDPATRCKVTVDGRAVDLTTFRIRHPGTADAEAAGRVLSARRPDGKTYTTRKATAFDRSLIDMHISHIRRKLETKRPFIKTIRSVGYQFLRRPTTRRTNEFAVRQNSAVVLGHAGDYDHRLGANPGLAGPRPYLLSRLVAFELKEVRAAYESDGRPGLQRFKVRFQSVFSGEGVLTDAAGRDLLTGADESALLAKTREKSRIPPIRRGGAVIGRPSDDGRYWFFFVIPRERLASWFLLPEHWWGMAAGIFLCYLLAFYLTQPVRRLQRAVESFGHGDLSARASSPRRDELGELARTFDRMADRIQMLVDAEHRLLLDISHELRSPLARLRVAVELARSGEDREGPSIASRKKPSG